MKLPSRHPLGRPPPRNARLRKRAACWLTLGVFALGAFGVLLPDAEPAQASSHATFVSNITESKDSNQTVSTTAQASTAFSIPGNTTDRYGLTSVVIDVSSGSGSIAVAIHNDSGGNPGTKIGNDLTLPGALTNGANTFQTSGVALNGGTTYHVVVRGTSGTRGMSAVESDFQSGTANWTIADTGRASTDSGSSWSPMSGGRSLRFTVAVVENNPYVSNTLVGSRTSTRSGNSSHYMEQVFTTGGATTDGYVLEEVKVELGSCPAVPTVSIWTKDTSGTPRGTQLGSDLSGPASVTEDGLNTYTANGIFLKGGTEYVAVVRASTSSYCQVGLTSNAAEVTNDGWTIADKYYLNSVNNNNSIRLHISAAVDASKVTNLAETAGISHRSISHASDHRIDQAFTTGGLSVDRYTLTSVTIYANSATCGTPSVGIYAEHSTQTDRRGTQVGSNLTAPATITKPGANVYTTSSSNTITLNGATKYIVGISPEGAGCDLGITTSDDESGQSGWAIGNRYRLQADSGFNSDSVRIGIVATRVGFGVSNLAESVFGTQVAVKDNTWIANKFTTGGAAGDRLTLSSVTLDHGRCTDAGGRSVSIHYGSGTNPGRQIGAALTNSSGSVWTASGITLNGHESYFVVVKGTASTSCSVKATASDAQAGATGWSIADAPRVLSDHRWGASGLSNSLRFAVSTFAAATDTTAPSFVASASRPADGALGVAGGRSLVAVFDEIVQAGTGNIVIKNLNNNADSRTIPVGNPQVNFQDNTVTINPTNALATGASYAVHIAATAIDDTAGNSFGGITNDTDWNFNTGTTAAPTTGDLVSNTGETAAADGTNVLAGLQTKAGYVFETGGDSSGYTISEVKVVFATGSTGTVSVALHESGTSAEGAVVATLTGTSAVAGTQTFTAPANTTLAPNTKYWVVVTKSTGSPRISWTASNKETGLEGWTIQNNSLWYINHPLIPNYWSSATSALQIAVRGHGDGASLSATDTGALTIANHGQAWWYKGNQDGATCTSVAAGTSTANASGLRAATEYIYGAFDAAGCSGAAMASVTFTAAGKYVANLMQADGSALSLNSYEANEFRTGGATSDRFSLASVVLDLQNTHASNIPTVAIYTNNSSNRPGTQIGGNLSLSGTLDSGNNTFTASGIVLTGATRYWVVVTVNSNDLDSTTDDGEDTGSATGWTIGNVAYGASSVTGTWTAASASRAMRFRVNVADASVATLAPSNVKQGTATLTISSHTGPWWYKGNQSSATCTAVPSGTEANPSGLAANTAYVYKAYQDSGCTSALELTTAATDAEFTTMNLTATGTSPTEATLTLTRGSGHSGTWFYRKSHPTPAGSCSTGISGNTANLSGLTAFTDYTYKAYVGSSCLDTNELASVSFTLGTYVKNLDQTTASGTVPLDYAANSFKTGGSATDRFSLASVVVDFGAQATNARVGIYTENSDNPGTQLGGNLTQVGSANTGEITFNASGIVLKGDTTYMVRLSEGAGLTPGVRRTASDAEDTGSATGWEIGDRYRVSVNGTSWIWTASGNTLLFRVNVNAASVASLAAGNVTQTKARLTISSHTGPWWYKGDQDGATCTNVPSGSTADLSSLTGGTDYVYKAYQDSGCTLELTTAATDAEFETMNLTVGSFTQNRTGATLTLHRGNGHTGNWYYERTAPTALACGSEVTGNTATLSGLTANTSGYVYKAYTDSSCTAANELASVTFATPAVGPTLTAENVKQTGATLRMASYTGTWYYKANKAPHNSCSTTAQTGATTVNVTGLTKNTAYTYKAYSDNGCTTEVTSNDRDAEFTTLELRATSVTETTATLNLDNHTAAWWYKRTVPADTTCTSVAAGGTGSLSSLTANTKYTYKAYSATGCGASDEIATLTFYAAGIHVTNLGQADSGRVLSSHTANTFPHRRQRERPLLAHQRRAPLPLRRPPSDGEHLHGGRQQQPRHADRRQPVARGLRHHRRDHLQRAVERDRPQRRHHLFPADHQGR